jgi:hypothetical protein
LNSANKSKNDNKKMREWKWIFWKSWVKMWIFWLAKCWVESYLIFKIPYFL